MLLQTEHGRVEVPIRSKLASLQPGKQIHVEIPVPADFAPSKKLLVEDAKVSSASGRTGRLPLTAAMTDIPRVHASLGQLTRAGVEVEAEAEMFQVRVAVPGSARPRDLLTIQTPAGTYDLNVPDTFNMHNRTIEVDLPVKAADAARLGGKTLTVSKLLLNGVDVATPSPLKRKPSFESRKPTRRVVFEMPRDAKPGDALDVQTELGVYQITVPPKAGKMIEAQLHVPPDCDLPSLTVAWVRKAEAAVTHDVGGRSASKRASDKAPPPPAPPPAERPDADARENEPPIAAEPRATAEPPAAVEQPVAAVRTATADDAATVRLAAAGSAATAAAPAVVPTLHPLVLHGGAPTLLDGAASTYAVPAAPPANKTPSPPPGDPCELLSRAFAKCVPPLPGAPESFS